MAKTSLTQRYCQLKEIHDACLSTEIRAGMTTFATMSYIIAVNVRRLPLMLRVLSPDKLTTYRHSSSPSPVTAARVKSRGTLKGAVQTRLSGQSVTTVSHCLRLCRTWFTDSKLELKLDLVIATAAVAGLSSILFGLFTNLPVGLG